jgi:hypothetical protein
MPQFTSMSASRPQLTVNPALFQVSSIAPDGNSTQSPTCRKRKDRPDRGSNPGLPKSSNGALPLRYPAGEWRGHQLQHNIAYIVEVRPTLQSYHRTTSFSTFIVIPGSQLRPWYTQLRQMEGLLVRIAEWWDLRPMSFPQMRDFIVPDEEGSAEEGSECKVCTIRRL